MKEKRYFCDWWDNMKYGKKAMYFFVMVIVAVLVGFVLMFFLGRFSTSDYPEDTYKDLEEAYLPYVHEGVGIDIIGLKEAVHGLRSPIIYNGEIQLKYGYTTTNVTITLDKNYKTTKIERNAMTKSEYAKIANRSNISIPFAFAIMFCFLEAIIGTGVHLISVTHKFLDKSIAKKRKNKS